MSGVEKVRVRGWGLGFRTGLGLELGSRVRVKGFGRGLWI